MTASNQTTPVKFDQGKARMDLVPMEAVEVIAQVLAFGAMKYAPWAWYAGMDYGRLLAAALRHLSAFQQGEDNDPESGLSHLAHAGCCILFLLTFKIRSIGTDDRYIRTKGASNEAV